MSMSGTSISFGTKQTFDSDEVREFAATYDSVAKRAVLGYRDVGNTEKGTIISVEVSGGGVSLIRVTDNGVGIPAQEVALAFERHATSKIETASDLFSIKSLGDMPERTKGNGLDPFSESSRRFESCYHHKPEMPLKIEIKN